MHRKIWEAAVGENLMCERQLRNTTDKYAVAVKKEETAGALPAVSIPVQNTTHQDVSRERICCWLVHRNIQVKC